MSVLDDLNPQQHEAVETTEPAPDLVIDCWRQRLRAYIAYTNSNPNWVHEREYLSDWGFSKFVFTEQATTWDDFLGWRKKLQGSWCFRGQRETEWTLQTSLEREIKVDLSPGRYFRLDRTKEEAELLSRFQEQAPNYFGVCPPINDRSGWFALMQHHGVPTRMMDWTYSPEIAMYFALEEEPQMEKKRSAVWAIDLNWLKTKEREFFQSEATSVEDLNGLLGPKKIPVIVRVDPLEKNERMRAQEGLFLWKQYAETPVYDSIFMDMMRHPELVDKPVIRKLEVEEHQRIDFLLKLRKKGIHRATLFPGLDGFCQSLKIDLKIKVKEAAKETEAWCSHPDQRTVD